MKSKKIFFFPKLKSQIICLLFLLLCGKIISSNIWLLSPIPDDPYYPTLGTTLLDIKDYDDAAYVMTTNEEIRASTAEGLGDPCWYNNFYYETKKEPLFLLQKLFCRKMQFFPVLENLLYLLDVIVLI